ncbi:MAG: FGGY family carbohydrate kinase [Promethearchaeia archaeon]
MEGDFYLGLDSSTQSLTALVIDFDQKKVVYRNTLIFDEALSQYGTENGVITLKNEKEVHSFPLMWVDALELMVKFIKKAGIDLSSIKSIAGSGQQHGTVYLNDRFEKSLQNLKINQPISEQIDSSLTRRTSPIWMDSSTKAQCKEIREKLGGSKKTIEITGSDTFERFSGPQIRKFYQNQPDRYEQTSTIHLVSSFLASILLGKNAPIDYGDGAGMNLMNIKTKNWDRRALDATAPRLQEKLPELCNSFEIIGRITSYFSDKYGFSPDTQLVAWSGDNPNSLVGLGIIEKAKAAISLGTSDTYFSYLKKLSFDFKGESHVFGAPTGDYMSLICYKNGSIARERIKKQYDLTWEKFSEILQNTPPGNKGKIMLPYFLPEIVPLVLEPKVYRFGLNANDIEGNVRAIIEAQFLSMRLHSQWILEKPDQIFATGGASANREILQIAADIFQTPILRFQVSDSAALGAALRAVKSYYDLIGKNLNWEDLSHHFLDIQESEVIHPRKEYKSLYDDMLKLYELYEQHVISGKKEPKKTHKKFVRKYFE